MARSSIIRDYDEGEVLLAAQKLRMQLKHANVSETALTRDHAADAGNDAVEGLVRPLHSFCCLQSVLLCSLIRGVVIWDKSLSEYGTLPRELVHVLTNPCNSQGMTLWMKGALPCRTLTRFWTLQQHATTWS